MKLTKLLLTSAIALTFLACPPPMDEDEVGELVPGKIVGFSENNYYQEHDLGLGDRSIEGYIDLSALAEKRDSLGYPKVNLGFGFSNIYNNGASDELLAISDIPVFYISPNIDTGYYKVSGLPDAETSEGMRGIAASVSGVDLLIDRENFRYNKNFSLTQWNNADSSQQIPVQVFKNYDSSITLGINLTYMVDDYWLANGELEDADTGPDYAEMTFAQLDAIADIKGDDLGGGGLLFVDKGIWGEEGSTYGLTYGLNINQYRDQYAEVNTLIGGEYKTFVVGIIVNDVTYHNTTDTVVISPLSLSSGEEKTIDLTIHIPNTDLF